MNKQAACQIRCLGFLLAASLVYSDAIGKPGWQCVSRVTQSVDALAAGNTRVQIKLYPGLNHFFMTAVDLPPPQDEEVPGHVDDQVIRDIAAWIRSVPPAQAVH
jgi:hypothetical protein